MQIIDNQYQYTCFIAKTKSIWKNIMDNRGEPVIYDFANFMYVLDMDSVIFRLYPHFNSIVMGIDFNS